MMRTSIAGLGALVLVAACSSKSDQPPAGMASASSGPAPLVYVSNEESNDVSVIDSRNDSVVATIAAGKRPRGIRVTPDGKTLVVAVSGSPKGGPGIDESKLPKPDRSKDGIVLVDLATRAVKATLPGGHDPEAFAISGDGRTIYVSNEDAGAVTVLDVPSGKAVAQIPVGSEPEGVTMGPDGKSVYVACEGSNAVYVIDATTRKVTAQIPAGKRPRSIVFTPDGAKAFIANEESGSITEVNAKTNAPVREIAIPADSASRGAQRPMGTAAAPDGHYVFISTGRGGRIALMDVQKDSITATREVGGRPWGLALTPDGRRLYVANGPTNDVVVIDVASGRLVKRVAVGSSPWGVAIGK